MKVLVTGGAGFIGSHIVDLLIWRGFEPIIIDNLSTGKREFIPNGVKLYETDIRSSHLEEIFQKENPSYVIHHAAQVDVSLSLQNPVLDAQSNILGTIQLLEYSRKYHVKKFIYASSCAVYGDTGNVSITESFPIQPLSFYGLSKYTPEVYIRLYHQLYGLSYCILRYSNVYGPRQTPKGEGGVVSIFQKKLLLGDRPEIFGDGEQTRDFVFVKDVAAANICALTRGNNEIINISTNTKISVNQLLEKLLHFSGTKILPKYLPCRKGDIKYSQLDNQKANKVLGWDYKYTLELGLKESLEYNRNHQNLFL